MSELNSLELKRLIYEMYGAMNVNGLTFDERVDLDKKYQRAKAEYFEEYFKNEGSVRELDQHEQEGL